MTPEARLASFRRFIEKAPDDPFPRYGLAMELRRQGRLPEACAAFSELSAGFPEYAATYLMHGQTLVEAGDPEAAKAVLRQGIGVCDRVRDAHTRGELEAALTELG